MSVHFRNVRHMNATLVSAAESGDIATVRLVLNLKANVHTCDCYGAPEGALRWSARNGYTEIVRILLQHRANIHTCGVGDTALCSAARNGHTQTVRVLIESKCNVHTLCPDFMYDGPDYPVREAIYKGHVEVVCDLVRAGANVSHFTDTFVKQHLTFQDETHSAKRNIDTLGLAVRMGTQIQRVKNFNVVDFERAKSAVACHFVTYAVCRDLCDFILCYI